MEKKNAIAIETQSGIFSAVNHGGGWTETMNETSTTVAGRNEKKDTIKKERRVSKKVGNMMKKTMSVPKVVSGEIIAADYDETAPAMVRSEGGGPGCRILVSNTNKPIVFYLNLAKRYIKQNNYVELSGLGRAIPTVVTIAEILKKDRWALEKDITISSVPFKDDAIGRVLMKAKIEILLEKTEKFDKNGASEICENETKVLSSETNANAFENKEKNEGAWS